MISRYCVVAALLCAFPLRADDLADQIRALDPTVLPEKSPWGKPSEMLAKDIRTRIDAANKRESEKWRTLRSKGDWEHDSFDRINALGISLGYAPPARNKFRTRVTGTHAGDGFAVDNITFTNDFGLPITANLYRPAKIDKSHPGIVIVHSHHNGKSQSELQDMGIGWARRGAYVLVPDMFGHGERRVHPFTDESKYPGSFRPGRQDYYFRYNLGMQLHLLGETLMGWFVWDLTQCVEVLLQQPGIDKKRIAMFGSVAGGGDPVAVAAALDQRIQVAAVFNFGGPQPESKYPLPADAETKFNYAGGGSWESTRNLRNSASEGFLPWVIVGSIAPRKLLYCHEFSWDRERDPVWKRLEQIYKWYGVPENLAAAHGTGTLTGKNPQGSHCNNIGPVHRKSMAPALKKWLGLDDFEADAKLRFKSEDLRCLTGDAAKEYSPANVFKAFEKVREKNAEAWAAEHTNRSLRTQCNRLLGIGEARDRPHHRFGDKQTVSDRSETAGALAIRRVVIATDEKIHIPVLILQPAAAKAPLPLVAAFAQEGKAAFLKHRADDIAELVRAGVAVALVDLRGTGETRPGDGRGRTSAATAHSASEWMLGQTLLWSRVRDLHVIVEYLRSVYVHDRIALWGDSFAEPNGAGDLAAPLDAEKLPRNAEPLGALAVMFAGLADENVKAIYARGGLSSYADAIKQPYVYLPHDVIVPGAAVGPSLESVRNALGKRAVFVDTVDAQNRLVHRGTEKPAEWLISKLKEK